MLFFFCKVIDLLAALPLGMTYLWLGNCRSPQRIVLFETLPQDRQTSQDEVSIMGGLRDGSLLMEGAPCSQGSQLTAKW